MSKEKRSQAGEKRAEDLPARPLSSDAAQQVTGGVSFGFSKIAVEYKPQKADGQ